MRFITITTILFVVVTATNQQELVTGSSAETVNITSSDDTNDEFSHIFQVQLELKSTKVEETNSELEKRLNDLVEKAFMMATYRHRKQLPPNDFSSSKSEYTTQIVKRRVIGESTFIYFVTFANGTPVTGEVVADDLNDLTVSQISAILHYPLDKIISHRDIENSSGVKWWLISGILGSGAVIFVIGWFILFIYFNTCGASQRCDEGDYMTRAQRAQIKKGIIINPSPPWTRGIYDHPLGEPWVDPGPVAANNDTDKAGTKKPSYKRSFRTLSEARLEKRLKEEKEAISKATAEVARKNDTKTRGPPEGLKSSKVDEMMAGSSSSTESTLTSASATDTENNTSKENRERSVEKRKRQTKIEPITTNTMNEEISEISSNEELPKNDGRTKSKKDEKKLRIEANSGIKLPNSKKRSLYQSNIKSDPDSDYGSTTNDEEGNSTTIPKKVSLDTTKHRPAAAGKQRTSLFDKEDVLHSMKHVPKVWTPYTAADKISSFFRNKRDIYPSPATPTSDDVFEVTVEDKP